jgi:hypothetical protein
MRAETATGGARVRERLAVRSRIKVAGFAALLTGVLVGGWGLAGVVASGSTSTAPQLYRVTVTKTIKVKGKDGKVRTRVVRSVRIVKRSVLHKITYAETVTTPGGTQIITTQTTKLVPVVRIRNKVVTINGKPVTIAQTVTDMQTQTVSLTQTIDNTSTQFIDRPSTVIATNTQTQTVTNTQTLPPDTVTATETTTVTTTVTATETKTETTTVVVTETQPPVTVTVTGP